MGPEDFRSNKAEPQPGTDWPELEAQVARLFTAAPLSRRSLDGGLRENLYPGRDSEVRLMLRAVRDAAKHVVLYGERGLGKTSLANIFWWTWGKNIGNDPPLVARIQSYPSDDFSSLWSRALKELRIAGQTYSGRKADDDERNDKLSDTTPDAVRRTVEMITGRRAAIIIIDEFDRLRDRYAREATANLLKCLHDDAINVTVILIGIANDVGELLTEHQSLRRALSLIKLQRMNVIDLHEVLASRLRAVPLMISDDARSEIVAVACGLPYYVQVLGKLAAESAITRKSTEIQIKDVNVAMQNFLVEGGQLFANDYDQATTSQRNIFQHVILASALTPADADGFFEAFGVAKTLGRFAPKAACNINIRRVQLHLGLFASDRRGRILTKTGSKPECRYRFSDALMQPFVVIRAIKEKMIDDALRAVLLRASGRQLEGGGYRLGAAEAYAAQLGMVTPTATAKDDDNAVSSHLSGLSDASG